ncbi:hypothetical protein DFR30_1431 [Thiogranum longum]|uniref:Asparagine synthase (Glutamine-hydrolysing) n=2 Tax=Thiogranum longum TaxID=1537524 RepID=A0A4R1HLS5_9GAMM|nr:hypothetical protein DFR30_1431 [Thiogranum longum]
MHGHHYNQFLISATEREVAPGFEATKHGGWILYKNGDLPLLLLQTLDGKPLGCILGLIIDTQVSVLFKGPVIIPILSSDSCAAKEMAIHQFLDRVGGRFVCIIADGDLQRLYLDAAGSLSCVYSNQHGIMASTPELILNEKSYYSDMDHDLVAKLDVSFHGWFPGGVTPHKSISRLLPNHYLDLRSWRQVRHWPESKIEMTTSAEWTASKIADNIKASIRAVTNARKAYLPVTAGRDSRMLLACAKAELDRTKLVIFVDIKENVDQYIVRKLESIFGLDVDYLPIAYASLEERDQWYYEVGHCVGGRISEIYPTLRKLDHKRIIMPGFGGEVGRAYYWSAKDTRSTEITPEELLRRFHLPPHPVLRRALRGWLAEVSELLDTFQLLDLAYIEHRLGAWGGPQTYGQVKFTDHIYPMLHRAIFKDILSLPPEYKAGNCLPVDIIRKEWPELLNVPFNKYPGIKGVIEKGKKIRRLPSKISRIIRGY